MKQNGKKNEELESYWQTIRVPRVIVERVKKGKKNKYMSIGRFFEEAAEVKLETEKAEGNKK